jgi:hypothetical protein
MNEQPNLQGNKLTLIGAVWYLLELAAIALFFQKVPPAGSSASDYAAYYAANQTDLPLFVVGVSAAILGRVAFTVGLRYAFRQFEKYLPLLDLAVGMSVVSVTVETVGMGMLAMALSMAGSGMNDASLFAASFHHATMPFQSLVSISFAIVVIIGTVVILKTRALPAWLGWIGLIGAIGHLLSVNAGYYPASLLDLREMQEFFGVLLMWAWMLTTGITLFRRAGSRK